MTIADLTTAVRAKALLYLTETDPDCELQTFPLSIADFVIEYANNGCHFPTSYTEAQRGDILNTSLASLAMACVDVYSRAGAEGQLSHSENGISRNYDTSWISPKLFRGLPNFASSVYGTESSQ